MTFKPKEELTAEEYTGKSYKETVKQIRLARQCMVFKLIKCDNGDCKNECCPLNKKYD